MSVMRFDPFGDPFRSLDRLTSQMMSGTRTPMGMPMDVWQAEDGYHVALDLPGVNPDSVEITTERNMLTIRAERRAEYEQDIDIMRLASELVVDTVVEPGDLRDELIRRYRAARGKNRGFARRRHGVTPV